MSLLVLIVHLTPLVQFNTIESPKRDCGLVRLELESLGPY